MEKGALCTVRALLLRIGAVLSSLAFSSSFVFLCYIFHITYSKMRKLESRTDLCFFIQIMREKTEYLKSFMVGASVCVMSAGLMALLLKYGHDIWRTLLQRMLFPIPLIWTILCISMLILDTPVLMIISSGAIAIGGITFIALLAISKQDIVGTGDVSGTGDGSPAHLIRHN